MSALDTLAPLLAPPARWDLADADATATALPWEGQTLLRARAWGAGDTLPERMRAAEVALRRISSVASLSRIGLEFGFRPEDLVVLTLSLPEAEHAAARAWLARRLPPEVVVQTAPGEALTVDALYTPRGALPTSQRRVYARDPDTGRIRVEAFELHVVEHCNLRCAHCCNTSPYLPPRTLSLDEIALVLGQMQPVLHADVLKIMGGEPLLHPQITEVLHLLRQSGVGQIVRLFTNGLLLGRMDDRFWSALDHLTVSTYSSAPVRPELLARIEEKARRHDVVLNIKPVDRFNRVMHGAYRDDAQAVQQTHTDCWLRHRCLVVRDHQFFVCTRAAYLPDLHREVTLHDPYPDPEARRAEDGVPLAGPDLGARVLAALNRTTPLHACRFCLGGNGPWEAHAQLSRADVAAGRLEPSR